MDDVLRFCSAVQAIVTEYDKLLSKQEYLKVMASKSKILGKSDSHQYFSEAESLNDELSAMQKISLDYTGTEVYQAREKLAEIIATLEYYQELQGNLAKARTAFDILANSSAFDDDNPNTPIDIEDPSTRKDYEALLTEMKQRIMAVEQRLQGLVNRQNLIKL